MNRALATALLVFGMAGAPAGASAGTLPWLHAEGTEIVDEAGAVAPLRGVCLGGWLFLETWIGLMDYPVHGRLYEAARGLGAAAEAEDVLVALGPSGDFDGTDLAYIDAFEAKFDDLVGPALAAQVADVARATPSTIDDSELPIRELLTARFGAAGRDRILSAYHDAWIQTADFDEMAAMGMSLLRLPMTYREILVVGADDLPAAPTRLNEAVMARVDTTIREAAARGMYVALDIQEAPGGQNDYAGTSTLYEDPRMQALTLEMWSLLSARYQDEPAVAMYSLLAEPMSAPTASQMVDLYDRIYDTIRAQGDTHLMVIHDGFKGPSALPSPDEMGWTDVVYSTHFFEWGMPPATAAYKALMGYYVRLWGGLQDRYQVPFYVGSFATFEDERYAYRGLESWLASFNTAGWPWTLWTWKRIDDPIDAALYGDTTAWGVHQTPTSAWRRADPWLDDEATLKAKLATYTSENVRVNGTLKGILEGGM